MKQIVTFILVLVGFTVLSANSVFSETGMADYFYGHDVQGMGMGEVGISDLFRMNLSTINPSLTTTLNNTTFSTAFSLGSVTYKNQSTSVKDYGSYFPYTSIIIPIKNHRFGISFNTISGGVLQTKTTNTLDTLWDSQYAEYNHVDSDLFRADVFYALKNKLVPFGIGMSYYFGHRYQLWKQDYTSSSYTDSRYELDEAFKNPSFFVGASKILNEHIAVGGAIHFGAKLKGETEYVTNYSTTDLPDNTFEIPTLYAGGLTWKFNEIFRSTFEGEYEKWSGTDSYYHPQNSYRIAAGFVYEPLWSNETWWKKIPVRTGFYYRILPFQVNKKDIVETAYTFGLSLPLQTPNNKIDMAIKLYTRGSVSDNTMQDKGFMITLGTSGFDIFGKAPNRIAPREIPMPDFSE